ncbi:MAG: fibronectin type III domain-containing protein [Bacteroidetes bacterium]|nr:fibronectin type III domain-containing protein [Bacteroidota bacterium]
MSLKKLMSILCMLAISMFIFTACENDDIDPDGEENPTVINVLPVGTMYAGQTGTYQITVAWDHSLSINESWFDKYELTISATGIEDQVVEVAKNLDQYHCGGLDASRTYTFRVVAVGNNADTLVRSTAKEIQWALATHFDKNDVGSTIKVYVRQSSLGSGLNLYSQEQSPSAWRVGNGDRWNLALGGRDTLIFGTASSVVSAMGYTLTGNPVDADITTPLEEDTDKLDDILFYQDLSKESYSKKHINLKTDNVATSKTKGLTFFARIGTSTANYQYAKILVLKNGDNGGYLHAATETNAYIELLISYQTRTNVPFAKPSF